MRSSILLVAACLVALPSISLCQSRLQESAATSLNSLPESIPGGAYLDAAGPSAAIAQSAPAPASSGGLSPPAPFINSISQAVSASPNGNLSVFTDDPNFVSVPGGGISQAVLTLGPCAVDIPHNHPRGAETSYMIYGNIQFGLVEEDARGNNLLFYNLSAGQSVHVPSAIMHFAQNPTCEPAAFVASFDSTDAGVQTVWASFARIPTHILNGATGFSEQLIDQLKGYPLVGQPGTGGDACLKACGLNFQKENKLTPLPQIVP